MDEKSFRENIIEQAKQINVSIIDNKMKQFYEYMQLLIEWNQKINITAITDSAEIINKHFIDSLTVNKFIDNDMRIIDIGTGGGFPGLPLQIVNNTLQTTLVDSLNKRVIFLNEIIHELKIPNIEAIHSRAEDLGKQEKFRESYDIAISRAVAPMNILLEYMMPFVKIGGRCICMKGPNIQEEITNSANAVQLLGGELDAVEILKLPETNMDRTIVIIKKIKQTPIGYPRKSGTPSKNPII